MAGVGQWAGMDNRGAGRRGWGVVGLRVEQKMAVQVLSSPQPCRVADGCWEAGQQMTGSSRHFYHRQEVEQEEEGRGLTHP